MRQACSDEYGIQRWLELWPGFSDTVHQAFADAQSLYQQGNVWYDPDMEYTNVNFRHPTHPSTNLAEARALDFISRLDSTELAGICTIAANQSKGHDIWYQCSGVRRTVNVKLATIKPGYRGVIISEMVRRELKKSTSSEIFLVDNYSNQFVFVDGNIAEDLFHSSHAKYSDKDVVFYDLINPTDPTSCIFPLRTQL